MLPLIAARGIEALEDTFVEVTVLEIVVPLPDSSERFAIVELLLGLNRASTEPPTIVDEKSYVGVKVSVALVGYTAAEETRICP